MVGHPWSSTYVRAGSRPGGDARDDIATAVATQAGWDRDFWRRRLDLWERNGGEGLRILVIVDGLNQNFLFKSWADWFQPLLEEGVRDMYRVVVSCWRSWWMDRLAGLANLTPAPIEIGVGGFNDEELDEMLIAMEATREDFVEPLLSLMRVPRLSRVAMAHRKALSDSGDVTVERVIYEDWKDRLRRQGSESGLDDSRMRAFIQRLGRQLRENVDRAVTRRNIGDILAHDKHDNGQTGEELHVAVDQLTSGGWFRPGEDPDTFKVEADRIAYVLGAALVAELKRNAGIADCETTVAEFLDPLKAHSLGARILRAATTIALVEEDRPSGLRRSLVERWLDEQNFGEDDFDALWRLAGLDAELFLAIAESDWLGERADEQMDEVLVKMLANAAAFATFGRALKLKLAEWLGTVWAAPTDEKDDRLRAEGRTARGRYRKWSKSSAAGELGSVRLVENGRWEWLGYRAVAVMSYLERAPYVAALEAWCLSRALMDRAWHLDQVAWLLRANAKDPHQTADAMEALIVRLERQRHPVCNDAAALAKKAMSDVRRIIAVPEDRSDLAEPTAEADEELRGAALFEAAREYLAEDGWKRRSATSGTRLIRQMIAEGLPIGGREVDLLLRHLPDIATVIPRRARRRLASAFEEELSTAAGSGGTPRRKADLCAAALLMRLYDASATEQGRLLLESPQAVVGREWGQLFRQPSARELAGLNLAEAPCGGQVLWLALVGIHLDEELIRSLDALSSLVTSADRGVRRRAVEIAARGGHVDALEQFAASRYATEAVDDSPEGSAEEFTRSWALIALESAHSESSREIHVAAECAALRLKLSLREKETPKDAVLADFARFLKGELDAMQVAPTWGMARYWFSYRDCVESLIAQRGAEALEVWLAAWLEGHGHSGVEWALLNQFPLQDMVRAIQKHAPEVSVRVYEAPAVGARARAEPVLERSD